MTSRRVGIVTTVVGGNGAVNAVDLDRLPMTERGRAEDEIAMSVETGTGPRKDPREGL